MNHIFSSLPDISALALFDSEIAATRGVTSTQMECWAEGQGVRVWCLRLWHGAGFSSAFSGFLSKQFSLSFSLTSLQLSAGRIFISNNKRRL